MPRLALCLLLFPTLLIETFAQEPETPDPYEWVIETYQYPSDSLARGFASPERGALRAPPVPGPDAPEKEIEDFIRKSNSIVSHYLEIQGLALPEGSLVIYDPESLTLTTRLPRIAQSSVAFVIEDYQKRIERYIGIDQAIIEAPTEMLRDIVIRAGAHYDHSPLLEELEKAIGEGKATLLKSNRIETRSGNRSKLTPTGPVVYPTELVVDSKNQIEYIGEESQFGAILEVDTVLGSDNETIDLNISVNHHYAPALRHKGVFTQRGNTILSSSVTDTFDAEITSQYTMKDGTAKMLAVWKPEGLPGEAKEDVLHTCFVTADVVKVLPLINNRLSTMLEKHGEKVAPIPEGKLKFEKVAEEIPEGMIVRRYTIPPTFLSSGGGRGGGSAVTDPFAAGPAMEPRFTVRVTAKDILKSAGIQFPPGSSANYLRDSSTLVIRNTPEQIELVEAYIMSIRSGVEKSIAMTLHIVEGPGTIMRDASRKTRRIADHSEVWLKLLEEDGVSIRTTNWIEARSGNRAKVEAGRYYHYPAEAYVDSAPSESEENKKEKDEEKPPGTGSKYSGFFDTARIGTVFEVDPVLGADSKTIDLNMAVEHDYAAPTVSNQVELTPEAVNLDGPTTKFHEARVTTQVILRTGMMRLVALWQPEGTPEFDNADIVQAVFIKAEVVELADKDEEEDW